MQVQDLAITILTYNDSTNSIRQNAARMIAEDLNKVGFKATVSVVSRDTLRKRLSSGSYDLALIGVNLSEVPILYNVIVSKGSLNYNNYSDATMDAYAELTLQVEDETSFSQTYSQIQRRIVDTLPFMGLLFRTGALLSTRSLGSFHGTRTMNAFRGLEYMTG